MITVAAGGRRDIYLVCTPIWIITEKPYSRSTRTQCRPATPGAGGGSSPVPSRSRRAGGAPALPAQRPVAAPGAERAVRLATLGFPLLSAGMGHLRARPGRVSGGRCLAERSRLAARWSRRKQRPAWANVTAEAAGTCQAEVSLLSRHGAGQGEGI